MRLLSIISSLAITRKMLQGVVLWSLVNVSGSSVVVLSRGSLPRTKNEKKNLVISYRLRIYQMIVDMLMWINKNVIWLYLGEMIVSWCSEGYNAGAVARRKHLNAPADDFFLGILQADFLYYLGHIHFHSGGNNVSKVIRHYAPCANWQI